jgi:hypothetical protein
MELLNTVHRVGFETVLHYVKDIGWSVRDSLVEVNALGMLVSIFPTNIVVNDVLNGRVKDKELILHILNSIVSSLPVSITLEDYVDALKLPGGLSIKRYEGRIVNFIANELIDVKVEQVNPVVNSLNGFMVKHPNATWACCFPIARGVGVQIAYWHGENGIPPGSSITYNTGIAKYGLSPSDIVLLAELTADRLVAMFRVRYGLKPKMYSSLYL